MKARAASQWCPEETCELSHSRLSFCCLYTWPPSLGYGLNFVHLDLQVSFSPGMLWVSVRMAALAELLLHHAVTHKWNCCWQLGALPQLTQRALRFHFCHAPSYLQMTSASSSEVGRIHLIVPRCENKSWPLDLRSDGAGAHIQITVIFMSEFMLSSL